MYTAHAQIRTVVNLWMKENSLCGDGNSSLKRWSPLSELHIGGLNQVLLSLLSMW